MRYQFSVNSEMARQLASAAFSGAELSGLEWRRDAACSSADPDMFWRADVRHALQVCTRCAVRPDCLAEVLSMPSDPGGVWGGTTHGQRRALRSRAGLSRICHYCGFPCPSSLSRYAKYCSDLCRRAGERKNRENWLEISRRVSG